MDLENDNKLQLLDIIGVPKTNLLFSSLNDILIYSIGSNIIFYTLKKNTKTFLQYYYKNEISTFIFLDIKEQLILIIDKSSSPLLSIWKFPYLEEIYSQEIFLGENFTFSDIYIEKLYSNLFIIIISAINCNLLYILKTENYSNFFIEKICKIPKISNEIDGFKCFYDDIYLIFISNNNLLYYLIDPEKIFNKNNYSSDEIIKLYQKFTFPFGLKKGCIEISNKFSLIFFLTKKGNCLIYNKKGENKTSINPLNKDENFISIFFDENSLCLGTDTSKIYIYNIDNNYTNEFKLKYYIKEQTLKNIKLNFQLNNIDKTFDNKNKYQKSKNINIDTIYLNQKLDKIFIKLNNNSIIYAPFTSLMADSRGAFFFNSLGNTSCLYSYNHSGPINSIEINNNYNEYETIFYTCSKDSTLIQYNIDFSTNKISNLFFDLNDILKPEKENDFNNNISGIYLTIIKFHPNDNTKLFAGDNKGYLYIFDINENYFRYKKYYIDDNSIESISFSKEGNLLCIGILTGKQMIYDIQKNCEFNLKLCDNYLLQNEIDYRINNYHVITYNYFFKKEKHRDCILFLKNMKNVEYSKLLYDKKKLIKKKITLNEFENDILDIQIHVSENYLIILNNKNKILINEINLGETTAVIDLGSYINKIYNFITDHSGLYICIICSNYYNNIFNDLIIIEIGTGNLVTYVNNIGKVYKIIFDYYSKYIITGSHDGILSLWKIPKVMRNLMINVLSEIEKNENYWEQFEIKYYNNNNNNFNKYNLNLENNDNIDIPKKFQTEITRNYNNINNSEEIEDNGPHKGIQTWQNNERKNFNNIINDNMSSNYSEKKEMSNKKIINKENEENDKKNNIRDYITNSYIPYNNNINNSKISNGNNKSIKSNKKKENNLENNLKEENSLQNCYEKFKKERLMKNSFIKPNINNKKIDQVKKSNKVNNRPLSSNRIIKTNKKYLNQPKENNKMDYFISKEKYNKKDDNIDFEIDFDAKKIRPNFDPNLCSDQDKQKYSLISKELIKPFISNKNINKNDYLRHNNENGYNIISNNNNNTEYPNFSSSNNNNNDISISQKYVNKSTSSRQVENKKINDAMNILMEKTKTKNNEPSLTTNYNINSNINNNINENKSISSKDISRDFAFINNVKIDPSRFNEYSEEKISSNINNNPNINLISNGRNIDTISSRKRNGINEKINNFENRLNYYGK